MADPHFRKKVPHATGNSLLNTERGVWVLGGSLEADTTWPDPPTVYVLESDLTVPLGISFNIDPGVVLKDVQSTYATIHFGNTDYQIRPENIQSEMDKKKR